MGQYFIMMLKIYIRYGLGYTDVFVEKEIEEQEREKKELHAANSKKDSSRPPTRLELAFTGLCRKTKVQSIQTASSHGDSKIGRLDSSSTIQRVISGDVQYKLELSKTALITMLSAQGPHPLEVCKLFLFYFMRHAY